MQLQITTFYSSSSFTSLLKSNGVDSRLFISWSPIAPAMMFVPEGFMEMIFLSLARDVPTIATDAPIKVNVLFATRQRISES